MNVDGGSTSGERDSGRAGGHSLNPLPDELGIPSVAERVRNPVSKEGLLALALLVLSLIAVAGVSIARFAASGKKSDDTESRLASNRPAAASVDPRRLDMSIPRAASAPVAAASSTRVPALIPTPEELDPIGILKDGQSSAGARSKAPPPEDAPVLLLSSRPGMAATRAGDEQRSAAAASPALHNAASPDSLEQTRQNLDGYQRQLQTLIDALARVSAPAGSPPVDGSPLIGEAVPYPITNSTSVPVSGRPGSPGLFGGQLPQSATPSVAATTLGRRSLTLPKGTAFTCALKTKVISAASGLVGCQVQRNVYSDDGRVLLIERGSHLDGEYRIAAVRPGTVRIPVLWTRIRTPHGVTVDIDSPGTGALGESGIDGYVDNRWGERIGAAILLSLIDDSVKLVIQDKSNNGSGSNTLVLPSTTDNTSKLAEKVLDSTINIPPLIYQNQGGIVGIYVARDVDFSSVYELRPTSREAQP